MGTRERWNARRIGNVAALIAASAAIAFVLLAAESTRAPVGAAQKSAAAATDAASSEEAAFLVISTAPMRAVRPIGASSPGSTRIRSSTGSVTTCRRRHPKRSRTPSSK